MSEIFLTEMKTGITRSEEFERKGLASFAVNVGTKCSHGCTYCSTGALLRQHLSFKDAGVSPYDTGYAIVDPDTPDRVARDARRKRNRGLVQLCTTVDAWAPEAQEHHLGRRCLEAILREPGWNARILTKNAAVEQDFDLIEAHRDRVLVGLSITATAAKEGVISVIEPNASPISERLAVMQKAHKLGLRTYGMLCPLMPGIADDRRTINKMVRTAVSYGAEEIFAEAVNPRGSGLRMTQEALETVGYKREAEAFQAVRRRAEHDRYILRVLQHVQAAVRKHADIRMLRFLLYSSRMDKGILREIRKDRAGVVFL